MEIDWTLPRTVAVATPRSRSGSDWRTAAEVRPRVRTYRTKVHNDLGTGPMVAEDSRSSRQGRSERFRNLVTLPNVTELAALR